MLFNKTTVQEQRVLTLFTNKLYLIFCDSVFSLSGSLAFSGIHLLSTTSCENFTKKQKPIHTNIFQTPQVSSLSNLPSCLDTTENDSSATERVSLVSQNQNQSNHSKKHRQSSELFKTHWSKLIHAVRKMCVNKSGLVLVLHLIGWEIGASLIAKISVISPVVTNMQTREAEPLSGDTRNSFV